MDFRGGLFWDRPLFQRNTWICVWCYRVPICLIDKCQKFQHLSEAKFLLKLIQISYKNLSGVIKGKEIYTDSFPGPWDLSIRKAEVKGFAILTLLQIAFSEQKNLKYLQCDQILWKGNYHANEITALGQFHYNQSNCHNHYWQMSEWTYSTECNFMWNGN